MIPLYKVAFSKDVDRAIARTLHSGYIAEGPRVKEFTHAVSKFLDAPYVVPVSSGTMALTIAYELAGIGPGDEVISTPLTCIATNTPLVQLGATIVWADCEPMTGMIDPEKLEPIITKKTKAIVVLHKDGDLARIDEIIAIARKHKLKVIEDAAHVFGASYHGKKIGSWGDFTCFSFQAIKHITTGDGGAIVCKNKADYLKARKLKWFGLDKEAPHKNKNIWMDPIDLAGYKGNMHDIAATIGLSHMKNAKSIITKYHENGKLYDKLLGVKRDPKTYPVYWVYTLIVNNRDRVMQELEKAGVASAIVHPRNDVYPLFKKFRRKLLGVDYYAKHEISVPCGWWVTKRDIIRIVSIIKKYAN